MKNPYIAGGDLDQAQPVQYLSNGGFLVPPKQPVVYRTADKAYLEARQKEADVYESQRAAYNAALEKYKAEVYNPYEQQLGAYNTAAAAYNRDVYEPYKSAYDQYAAAVSAWNEGPRTTDYAGPSEPTLKPFEMAVPTAPNPFSMTAPVVPFKEEEVRARQAEAAKRAEADAAGRGVAIAVANDPSRFNLAGLSRPSAISGMSVPGFMKGGPVMAKAPEVLSSKQMLRRLGNKVKRYADGGEVGPLKPPSGPAPQIRQEGGRLVYPDNFMGPIPPGAVHESDLKRGSIGLPSPGVPTLERIAQLQEKLDATPPTVIVGERRVNPFSSRTLPILGDNPEYVSAKAELAQLQQAAVDRVPVSQVTAPSMDRQADLEYMQTRPEAPVGGQDPDRYFPSGSGAPDMGFPSGSGGSDWQHVMPAPRPEPAPVPTPKPLPQLERRPLPSYVMPPPPPIIASPETLPDLLRGAGSAPVVARPVGAPVSYVRPSPVYTPVPVPDVPMYGRPRGDVGNIPVGNIPVGNIPIPDIPLPGRQTEGARREPRPADQGPAFFNLQPGQAPGTVPLPYTPMNFQAIPTALDLLQQDPNLSPQVLGGMENLGYRTDRLGNVILAPATPMLRTFADGGLAAKTQALNKELLADEEEDDAPILTDPVGTASQMLRELNPQTKMAYEATPKKVSMKRVSKTPMESPSGSAKGMKMELEEISAMKAPKGYKLDQGMSRADLEELAREYGLKRDAALATAKGLMKATFEKPTLEQPTLTKGSLTKRRFEEGGEVKKDEGAEDEKASAPAYDDPFRSGRPLPRKGRAKGTQESNEALSRAVAQGVANMPYNLAGAPVDLINMVLTPVGLGSQAPVMGSEWIKQKMTDLGVRPEPPTDPTAAALYGASDLGSSLVNPAGVTRAGARAGSAAAQATGKALSSAAKDFQQYNRMLDVPGASYAVKPGGGNWYKLEDRLGELKLSDIPLELYAPNYTGALYEGAVRTNKINQAVNDWVDTKLSKYVRNEVGTVNDPVLKQIDQWELVQKPKLLEEKDRQINKLKADIERAMAERNVGPEVLTRSQARLNKLEQERLFIENQQGGVVFSQAYPELFNGMKLEAELKRRRAGMPEEPVSKSEAAQQWEALSDVSVYSHPARLIKELNSDPRLTPLPSWFEKLSPEDKVYGLGNELRTSFNHVVDELRNALDPTVGLPKNLQITPEDLKKSSVEKVFKLVDDINAFRRVQQREADMLIAANKATVPVKTYETVPGTTAANDKGLRWVELKIPPPRQDFEIPQNFDIVQPRATARDESWAIFDRETGKYTTTGLSSRQDAVDFLQYLDGQKDLQNALKYEGRMLSHCVGGYCPAVETGESSIFSLRDSKGVPKATVEFTYSMTPGQYYHSKQVSQGLIDQITALENSGQRFNWEEVVRASPEYQKAARELNQVKGFDNGAPGEEQLPFVLDFLRSGRFSNITKGGNVDLRNAGIFQVTPGQRLPGFSRTIEPGFYTRDDFKRMAQENDMPQEILDNWMGKLNEVARRGFAHGGFVNKHDAFIKAKS